MYVPVCMASLCGDRQEGGVDAGRGAAEMVRRFEVSGCSALLLLVCGGVAEAEGKFVDGMVW